MHIVVIAGLSKSMGDQFSMKNEYVLTKEGMVMTYNNLRSLFGYESAASISLDFNTPYRAGIHLYNCIRNRGYECTLINFLDLEREFFEKSAQMNPEIVAVSTTYLTSIRAVKRITEIVRRYASHSKIVVGGPLVYNSFLLYQKKNTDYEIDPCRQDYFFINEEGRYHEDIDFFVVEEQGEDSFIRLIDTFNSSKDPSDVSNLAFYKDRKIYFTTREAEGNDFSHDLVNIHQLPDRYIYPMFPVRGSRGCPYKCRYCNFASHRSFVVKPQDVLATELDLLSANDKVRIVRFTDDNLFLNRKNLERLCETIIKYGRGIKWTSFIRANSITPDNISLLKESGCLLAQIGVESGDLSILKNMNKKEAPEHYLEAVELLNTYGIFSQLYFIIGFPGETTETIKNTVQLINQFKHDGPAVNFIMVFPFVLAPLSPIYSPESRAEFRLTGYMLEWKHSTMNSVQATRHARELLMRIETAYPFYGMEELTGLDAERLKQLSHLRLAIRKAEILNSHDPDIGRMWNELRVLVAKNDTGYINSGETS